MLEFFPGKLRQGDVAVHLSVPRLSLTMHSQHQSHDGGGRARFAIATVSYSPPQTVLYAFFTNVAVSKKSRSRTIKSVVVQRVWTTGTSASRQAAKIDGDTMTKVL